MGCSCFCGCVSVFQGQTPGLEAVRPSARNPSRAPDGLSFSLLQEEAVRGSQGLARFGRGKDLMTGILVNILPEGGRTEESGGVSGANLTRRWFRRKPYFQGHLQVGDCVASWLSVGFGTRKAWICILALPVARYMTLG